MTLPYSITDSFLLPFDSEATFMEFRVPHPLIYPNYVFDGQPTPAQMRQRAIEAMEDFLSIQFRMYEKPLLTSEETADAASLRIF